MRENQAQGQRLAAQARTPSGVGCRGAGPVCLWRGVWGRGFVENGLPRGRPARTGWWLFFRVGRGPSPQSEAEEPGARIPAAGRLEGPVGPGKPEGLGAWVRRGGWGREGEAGGGWRGPRVLSSSPSLCPWRGARNIPDSSACHVRHLRAPSAAPASSRASCLGPAARPWALAALLPAPGTSPSPPAPTPPRPGGLPLSPKSALHSVPSGKAPPRGSRSPPASSGW